MSVLNIAHLSDLHYSYKNENQYTFIRRPLFDDLRRLPQTTGKIDYAIISGDLVHNPDEDDVYYRLYDVLSEIVTVLSLPLDRVVVCPGNHDVHQSALKSNSVFRDGLAPHASDPNYISKIYDSGQLSDYAQRLNRGFFELSEYIGLKWEDAFFVTREFAGNLNFVSLNTSVYCSLRGSEEDKGKLFIPISAVDKAVAKVLKDDATIFFVHHHPVTELNESHERALKSILRIQGAGSLFGHIHNPVPSFESTPAGKVVHMQSGALYEQSEKFRGYCVYSYDSNIMARKITYRTFFAERGEFDEGINVAKRGQFFPTPEEQQAWYNRKPEYSRDELNLFLRNAVRSEIMQEFDSALIDQGLTSTFVFPPFRYVDVGTAAGEDGLDRVERLFHEQMLKDGAEHIVAFFPQEAGGTSFLRYIALSLCAEPDKFADCRIPIYIDLKGQKPFAAAVSRSIRQAYPAIDDQSFGLKARESDQPFVFLIDNAEPDSAVSRGWIEEAFKQFPKARFVVVARTPLSVQSRIRPDFALPFPYRAITLSPLGRREVRALVAKISLPEGLNKNLVVDDITARFSALGVPLTAPLIVIYLVIVQAKGRYAPINASVVIENFVEILLQKSEKSITFRDELDFGEQISLLTRIAEEMVRVNVRSIPRKDLTTLIETFYSTVGIDRDAVKVIEHFEERKMFESVNGDIYIKYQFVFSYLIARRMVESEAFREFILNYDLYGEYVQEIDIYCGLSRGDEMTLVTLASHYSRSKEEILEDVKKYLSDGTIDEFQLPKVDDPKEFVGQIAKEILSEDSKTEDGVDDPMITSDEFVQYMQRPELRPKLFKWIQGLQAYSVAVKNLELIPAATKSYHLDIVLNGWGEATALATKVVALCLENEVVTIAGVKIRFVVGSAVDGGVMRSILTAVPRIISYYSRIFLASDKLEKQLRASGVDSIGDFIRTGIILDLRVSGYLNEVEKFLKRMSDSLFMMEIMMVKLRDSYFRFGVNRSEADRFRQIIAETYAGIVGDRGEERNRTISRMMQHIEKRRLVQSK